MTNCLFKKYWFLTAAAVLFFASASFAQVPMELTSAGDVIVWNGSSGVYVDPYQATVNGTQGVTVLCDDWANNTYLNEQWNANSTMTPSLPSTGSINPPMFTGLTNVSFGGSSYTLTQAQLYDALAYLGYNLLQNSSVAQDQVDDSFAMWELDYAAGRNSGFPENDTSNPTTFLTGSNYSGEQTNVTNDIVAALNNATGGSPYDDSKWEILSPAGSGCTSNCSSWPAQEFLTLTTGNGNGQTGGGGGTSAPESSATLVFGADMLGLLGLAFIFRRRLLRTIQ